MNYKIKTNILTFALGITTFLFISCNVLLPKEIKELEKVEIFSVSKNKKSILLDGVINSSALYKFKFIANENPKIKRIEIKNCDGSINDKINLELAKYIYDNKYDIHLLDNGLIASGGTDLFLAGMQRTKGSNTKIGVHSWAGRGKTATNFPVGHKHHLPYINYYVSVGFTQKKQKISITLPSMRLLQILFTG
ncbi:MAG: hypothetical protein JKY48_09850 [Flavobacteriales bacterium]|nr:hypothetical protein [Flavobacteriales bacterium]